MSTISNERLEELANGDMEVWYSESQSMARELLALRKERERAEPVAAESYIDDSDLLFAIDLNDDSEDFQTAQWLKELRRRRAAPPAPVVPVGLRIALSNAGIAAPESDEVLWASQQDYIQMLVTWVKERKPFKPAPVADDSLPYDPQIAEYEQIMEAELKAAARTAYKVKSGLSQMAEKLVRETTALAEKLSAETDTTSQQFESMAGRAVGGSEGFECTPVADLYELLTKCGECYDYTTSAKVAADWIKEGYSAREYVKLDRLQEALIFAAPEPCK